MTEIDKSKANIQQVPQARRSVLAKFIANFSGGMSLNTVFDSGSAAQAQVSANMDPRQIAYGLRKGGNSTNLLEGGFEDFVPVDGRAENLLQTFPDQIVHIAEVDEEDLLNNAPKPAVISNLSISSGQRPARTFVVSVFSVNEEPGADMKAWFTTEELKPAA